MFVPNEYGWKKDETLAENLERQGINRREFLTYCGEMGVVLGVGSAMGPTIMQSLSDQQRPSVIWLQLQECTGCVESVLRTESPTIGDLILNKLSLDYQHTLMAAAGHRAEEVLQRTMEEKEGEYLLVVTGSVPMNDGGVYTTVGGRTAHDVLVEAADGAAGVIAVGACAHYGSVQAADPNPTGAVRTDEIVTDQPVVNIAGCPPIADTVTATLVHYLTFGSMPSLDGEGRPEFAYGARIHDQCPKRANYDAGQFVQEFDDEGARRGWCLYEVGCKGPATFSPCPIFQWNSGTDWPIGAGHPCIGCTEPHFWDSMTPFYERLPGVAGFGVERTADEIGLGLAVGAAAGVGAHAVATGVQRVRDKRKGRELPVADEDGGESSPGAEGGESNAEQRE